MKKIGLVVEILKLLAEKEGDFLTTTEIFNILCSRGVLNRRYEKAERKRLHRALNDLFIEGYVERRFEEFKGKKPEEWRLNLKAFPYLISYSQEELISLFLLTAFVPEKYKKLEILKPALKAIDRFGRIIEDEKKKLAKESFLHLPTPVERFSLIDGGTLKLIFQAIVERRGVVVTYGKRQKEILPLKVFGYNGNLYLSALDVRTKEYQVYLMLKLRAHHLTNTELSLFYRKKFKDTFFSFDQKPFILKIHLPADYYTSVLPEHKVLIYPTQFHYEVKGDTAKILLVAYPTYRFASWIILDEVLKILPPRMEEISLAKEKKLQEIYSGLTFSLKETNRRFRLFKKHLEDFLRKRIQLLSD